MRVRSTIAGGLVLVTLLVALATLGSWRARADAPSPLAGVWTNLDGDGGRSTIEAEVDRAIEPLFPLIRTVARRRILENNPPIRRLELRLLGSRVRVDLDNGRISEAAVDQWTNARSRRGDAIRIRMRLASPTSLRLEQRAAEGGSRTLFRLEPNGTLVQDVTIDADQLPDTIHYTLRYRKQGA